jgi:hypothetical protein
MNVCQFCTVNFSTNQSLKRHYSRCKDKTHTEKYEVQLQVQKELCETQFQAQLQAQRDQYEQQLQAQRDQYEQQLQAQLQIQREQYERELQLLRTQLEKFETQLFEIAKQPKQNITNHNNSKTTNQIQNNQYNQYREYLAPMTLTQEKVRAKLLEDGYQQKLFEGGKHAIIEFVIELLCEDGKQMVIRVDLNRNKYIYRIDDKIYVDEDLIGIRDIFTEPIKKSLLKEYSRLSELYPKKELRLQDQMSKYLDIVDQIANNKKFKNHFEKSKINVKIEETLVEDDQTLDHF